VRIPGWSVDVDQNVAFRLNDACLKNIKLRRALQSAKRLLSFKFAQFFFSQFKNYLEWRWQSASFCFRVKKVAAEKRLWIPKTSFSFSMCFFHPFLKFGPGSNSRFSRWIIHPIRVTTPSLPSPWVMLRTTSVWFIPRSNGLPRKERGSLSCRTGQ
jgi:hypothetical protein